MAEPADVNVDDLRRRARRRLVGAIVLALAAAVFVPMLLESDPKPLGEDVSVRIPPVDDGKFVNRLNETSKATPPKSTAPKIDARADPKPEAMKTEPAKTEPQKVEAPKIESPKVDSITASPSSEATPAAPAITLAPPAAAPAPAVAAATSAPAQNDPSVAGFSVQLAAFSDDKGANSLANKLKKAGFPAYTEPLVTTKGTTLWRVRVGPYPSRDAAASSRDKLKSEGYSGIVAAAK